MKRYRESGGEPGWDSSGAEAPQPGRVFRVLTAIIVGIAVMFPAFAAILVLSFLGWAWSAAVAVAVVAGGFVLRRTLRSVGTAVMVAGLAAALVMSPAWWEMRQTDLVLNRLTYEVCSEQLPEDVSRRSCEGRLAHESNGNWCDYQVSMLVSSPTDPEELKRFFDSMSLPRVRGSGAPSQDRYFEVLDADEGSTTARFTAIPGFVNDWRCQ